MERTTRSGKRAARRKRQAKRTIEPYQLVLFEEAFFEQRSPRRYMRDRKGRFAREKRDERDLQADRGTGLGHAP